MRGSHGKIMKLIPVFLIIFLFSISLILAYVAWTTILTSQSDKFASSNDLKASSSPSDESSQESASSKSNLGVLQNLIPFFRRGVSENGVSNLETVDEKALLGPDLFRNVERIKMKVISNLRRYLLGGAKVTGHVNAYGVDFTKFKQKLLRKPNVHEMMCRIKNLDIDIINENTSPVFHNKIFPQVSLFDESNGGSMEKSFQSQKQRQRQRQGMKSSHSSQLKSIARRSTASAGQTKQPKRNLDVPIYRSCAVVPNSAALDGSQHGIDIDSHDFILRFNKAPTVGFEDDVGTLTSMRIVNSQVVTKPEFLFPHSSYYDDRASEIDASGSQKTTKEIEQLDSLWLNTRKFLMWDPCNYTSTVEQWYSSPEFSLFGKYFNLTTQDNPNYGRNRFYILNCRSIWKMWDLLQEYSIARIYGTPPTSGFIGIMLALQVCERVDVYEYIPSVRESVRCNYYGPKNDSNPSCTYGSWHPVSAEKLFALELADNTDKQIFMDGYLSIPGVSAYKCNN